MKSHAFPLTAFSAMAVLLCCAPAIASEPPVCDIVQCSPSEFQVQTSEYACPNSMQVNSPITATIECLPKNRHSMTCKAYPFEVTGPMCGGPAINLIYDWSVKVGNVTYPYPPSNETTISVSCMGRENVDVSVTVWNGTYSSTWTSYMNCGDSAL